MSMILSFVNNSSADYTTNCSERLNRTLKQCAGNGAITFYTACTIISDFKKMYLNKHRTAVINNNMNRKGKATAQRESIFDDILLQWFHFTEEQKYHNAVNFALKLGSVDASAFLNEPFMAATI